MTTKVSQTYTPSLNLSMTTRNGVVTRITTWTTGVPQSTEVAFLAPGLRTNASASTVLRRARKGK